MTSYSPLNETEMNCSNALLIKSSLKSLYTVAGRGRHQNLPMT